MNGTAGRCGRGGAALVFQRGSMGWLGEESRRRSLPAGLRRGYHGRPANGKHQLQGRRHREGGSFIHTKKLDQVEDRRDGNAENSEQRRPSSNGSDRVGKVVNLA
jgi:hypothetical protein